MTVSNTTSRNQYTATSGQTVFPYTFEIFDKGDVVVLKNGTALSEGTNYTVSGVGNDNGGNITLTVGATAGDILTIYRDMAYQRTTDYQTSGDFLAQEVNDDFDRLWLAMQQGEETHDRAIVKPITDAASIDMTLPSAADRANSYLLFDSTGAPSVVAAGDPSAPDAITRQDFTGDGSTFVYTLASAPGAAGAGVMIFIDGIQQDKDSYTITGTTLTFSEAPPLNSNINLVQLKATDIGEADSNSVTYIPAGTGAVQTSVQSKLRETVSVKDFGAVGDGVTDDTAAIQAALDSGNSCIVVPSGVTVRITSEVSIPNNVDLTVDGSISGTGRVTALGSSTITGIGSFACGNVWQLKVAAGDINIHGLTFGKGSTYGVYVYPSATINSLKIQNNSFDGNQYGVLKNNNSDIAVYSVLISDNLIQNSTGDGIEWNIGTTDERIIISNNTIYNTAGTITNSGLGIGVAGKAYTNDGDPANQTKYVFITDNFVKGAGQGIHCENVAKVKISGNHVSDCTSSFAGPGLSDIGAITTYQLIDGSITDNYIYNNDSGINLLFGSISGTYIGSPENIDISGNSVIDSGQTRIQVAVYTASGYVPDDYPTITIKNNSLMNSRIFHQGACNLFLESNTISTLSGETGLTVDYRTNALGDPAYYPAYNLFFVAKNNSVYDKMGRVNVSFSNISARSGYDGNIKVHQSGNSFTIPVTDSFAQGSNKTISTASSSGFPYGIEFQTGDIVVNTATPAMYIVTTAGSRNKGSDLCVILDETNGIVRTGNYAWTSGDNHEWGQAITLTAGATVITGYVSHVYIESSQYRLKVIDASGNAVDLSAIGNGNIATITATNPVAYTQVV